MTRANKGSPDFNGVFPGMTCGFAEMAGRLMEEITCEAVARILDCDPKLMWEVDQNRMEVMLQFLQLQRKSFLISGIGGRQTLV